MSRGFAPRGPQARRHARHCLAPALPSKLTVNRHHPIIRVRQTGGGRMGNHLYYGDNLAVLRESIPDASVDLIYLDTPFNSNASYNVLFRGPSGNESAAQIEAFDDTWHWTDAAEEAFGEVLRSGNGAAAEMLRAMRSFLGENDIMAYLGELMYLAAAANRLPHGQRVNYE